MLMMHCGNLFENDTMKLQGMLGWQGHKTQPMELYILCRFARQNLGDVCQGVLKHLQTFTPVSDVSGVSGVLLVIQQMIGGIGKTRCRSRPGSSMQMLFVFSSALLVALPQHACHY